MRYEDYVRSVAEDFLGAAICNDVDHFQLSFVRKSLESKKLEDSEKEEGVA